MIFLWALVACAGLVGLWIVLGERVMQRGMRTPLSKAELAAATGAAFLAIAGVALVVLVGIDNATVEHVNCVEVVRPDTGEDELSCQEAGGLDWLPTWVTGGSHRIKR